MNALLLAYILRQDHAEFPATVWIRLVLNKHSHSQYQTANNVDRRQSHMFTNLSHLLVENATAGENISWKLCVVKYDPLFLALL